MRCILNDLKCQHNQRDRYDHYINTEIFTLIFKFLKNNLMNFKNYNENGYDLNWIC